MKPVTKPVTKTIHDKVCQNNSSCKDSEVSDEDDKMSSCKAESDQDSEASDQDNKMSNHESEGDQDSEVSNKASDWHNQDEVCQDNSSHKDSEASNEDDKMSSCKAERHQDSEASEQGDETSNHEADGNQDSKVSNEASDQDNQDKCSQGQESTRATRRLCQKDSKPLYIQTLIRSRKVKKLSKAKSSCYLCLQPMLDCPTDGDVGIRSLI